MLVGLFAACLGATVIGCILDVPSQFLARPDQPHSGRESLGSFARGVLAESGASVLLLAVLASSTAALLASLFLWRLGPDQSLRAILQGGVLGAAGLISTLIVRFGIESVGLDVTVVFVLAAIGAGLAGQASRSMFRFAGSVALLCLATAVAGTGLFYFVINSRSPETAEQLTMTPGDAQRIETLRDEIRRVSADGDPVELALTARDMQLIASRFLARSELPVDCKILIEDGEIACLLVVEPWTAMDRRLQIEFELQPTLLAGSKQLDIDISNIRLGTLPLPRVVSFELSRAVSRRAPQYRPVQSLLAALDEVTVTADAVRIRGDLDASLVTEIWGPESGDDDLLASVQECGSYLLERSTDLPRGDQRLGEILRIGFEWARSSDGTHSAVSRNRAALVTLAAMVGSNDIAQVIQHRAVGALPQYEYRFTKYVTARDRRDLAQHLVATAGLAAWTSQSASETVGLLKEEWDAARGGSGFSFADFQADCAGARLGYLATRDEESARRLQQQIVDGISISDILPDVDGLPENISAEQLRDEYGGVEGDEFRRWEAEIQRRLDEAPLLQVP